MEANVRPKRKRCSTTNPGYEGQYGHQVEQDDNEEDIKVENRSTRKMIKIPSFPAVRERAATENRARANLSRVCITFSGCS